MPTASTTTIRLPEGLRSRIAAAAARDGTTAHAFILEAIAEKAERAERRAGFDAEAERRYAAIAASGKTVPWSALRGYLERRVAGQPARRPAARKLAR